MLIDKIGEFEAIRRFIGAMGGDCSDKETLPDNVIVGNGDDACVIRIGTQEMAFTVDQMRDGMHFLSNRHEPEGIGYRAAAAALSDLAAMGGAEPVFSLVCVSIPRSVEMEFMERVYSGISCCMRAFGCHVCGGDTVSGSEISISIFAAGVMRGPILCRGGATKGEAVLVTGRIGGPELGLHAMNRFSDEEIFESADLKWCVNRFYRPEPRIEEAREMAKGRAKCAIDISDGLFADLRHICEMSGVGMVIDLDLMEEAAEVVNSCKIMGFDYYDHIMSCGEEFEIIITAEESDALLFENSGLAKRIGRVVKGREPLFIGNGSQLKPLKAGWDHFSG